MLWKTAAKVYINKRREFARMDAATFAAYHEKWQPRAVKSLYHDSGVDSHRDAQWEGFNDALADELHEREGLERNDTINDELAELSHLLDYLYAEED